MQFIIHFQQERLHADDAQGDDTGEHERLADVTPVMNGEELQKGLTAAAKNF